MGFVRVVIPESGAQVTVSEAYAESAGLKPVKGAAVAVSEGGAVLPATDKDGKPFLIGEAGVNAEDVVVAPANESEVVK